MILYNKYPFYLRGFGDTGSIDSEQKKHKIMYIKNLRFINNMSIFLLIKCEYNLQGRFL